MLPDSKLGCGTFFVIRPFVTNEKEPPSDRSEIVYVLVTEND